MKMFKNIGLSSLFFPIFLSLLFVVVVILRLLRIDAIPAALTHDEMIYVVQARALALTGTDLTGKWQPLFFQPFHPSFAELPAVLMSPAAALISQPVIAARITHTVVGFLVPFILGWFAWLLFAKKELFWPTTILASVNPWIWQMSRMSFDPLFSLAFYLLGAALILKGKRWSHLLALPILILGFFQYQGHKLVFIPWIGIWYGLWLWRQHSKLITYFAGRDWRKIINLTIIPVVSLLLVGLLFAWYVLVSLPQQMVVSRVQKTILTDTQFLSEIVQTQRRVAMTTPWQNIISNKGTAMLEFIATRYAQSVSPEMLFVHGEAGLSPFSVWSHGFFYAIDALLILVGLVALSIVGRDKKPQLALLAALVIAPLPAVLSTVNNWFFFRASLLYMLLIVVVAFGFWYMWKQGQLWLKALLVASYSLSVALFSYQYFFRYPVYAADGQFFQERVIASYIARLGSDTPVLVYTSSPEFVFNSYLFYTQGIQADTMTAIQAASGGHHQFQFGNVEFSDSCFDPDRLDDSTVIISEVSIGECDQPSPEDRTEKSLVGNSEFNPEDSLTIPSLKDSGEMFRIYNDRLCQGQDIRTFVSPRGLDVFSVEKLSDQQLCESWITDLRPLRMKSEIGIQVE